MFNQKADPKFLEALKQVLVPAESAAQAQKAELSESLAKRYVGLKPTTLSSVNEERIDERNVMNSEKAMEIVRGALAHRAAGKPSSVHFDHENDQVHHTIEHGNKTETHVFDFRHDPKSKQAHLKHVQTITAHYEQVEVNAGDELVIERTGTPFSKDYKSQLASKPGEKAGFDSKKVSTGTVYNRKLGKDKEESGEKEVKESSSSPFSKDYKSQLASKPGEKAGFDSKKVSTGTVYKRQAVKEEQDTPGNSEHQCAIHVKHSTMGEGRTIFSQHAEPDSEGMVAWYDVMFEHGIEKKVPVGDLEILVSESHMNHRKKKQ